MRGCDTRRKSGRRLVVAGAVVLLVLGTSPAGANLAAPVSPGSPAGNLSVGSETDNTLRIEHEELELDLRPGHASTAVYFVVNTGAEAVSETIAFVHRRARRSRTREATPVLVKLDGIPQQLEPAEYEPGNETDAYEAQQFLVDFPPGQTRRIVVTFPLAPGYNQLVADVTPTYPQAAHAGILTNLASRPRWFHFNLSSARTFSGGFGTLHVRIIHGRDRKLVHADDSVVNALSRREYADRVEHVGRFEGLPADAIDLYLVEARRYRRWGLTAGAGYSWSLAGEAHTAGTQFTGDLMLGRHQLSAGLHTAWNGPVTGGVLEYRLFPGGQVGYSYATLFDVRAGVGVVLHDSEAERIGIRGIAGFRFIVPALELHYELYPREGGSMVSVFSADHRIGIMGTVSW